MTEIQLVYDNNKKKNNIKNMHHFTPARILAVGFVLLILLGGFLLSLPIATEDGLGTPFLDALFTATSATCVTGLVVVDTADHYSVFGELVIILLIQIGGLGFMSFATLLAIFLGKRINLKERILLQESYNQLSLEGIVRLVRNIAIFSFSIEALGAVILFFHWYAEMGVQKASYYAFFHSVSAFNNAGFDLFGDFSSLTASPNDVILNITIISLIVIGGLGFSVLAEIYTKGFKHLSLHSRLVLQTTAALILGGAILIFLLEMNNPQTMGNSNLLTKIFSSFFHSVSPRTAGFNTLPMADLAPATLIMTIVLMFIGGSPGSTAGGIKTTTFTAIIYCLISVLKGREAVTVKEKTLSHSIIKKAFAVSFLAFSWVTFITFLLLLTENASFLQIIFETVSAFGTVGLTMGITPSLSVFGKMAMMLTMFIGRVGLITVILAVIPRNNNAVGLSHIKYPEEKIIIG